MALIKTETTRELETLEHIEKKIRRREKCHRFLIAGLATLLAASVAVHIIAGCKKR